MDGYRIPIYANYASCFQGNEGSFDAQNACRLARFVFGLEDADDVVRAKGEEWPYTYKLSAVVVGTVVGWQPGNRREALSRRIRPLDHQLEASFSVIRDLHFLDRCRLDVIPFD